MPLTAVERNRRTRQRSRVLAQITSAGYQTVPADVLIRRPDGELYAWTHETGWSRL